MVRQYNKTAKKPKTTLFILLSRLPHLRLPGAGWCTTVPRRLKCHRLTFLARTLPPRCSLIGVARAGGANDKYGNIIKSNGE